MLSLLVLYVSDLAASRQFYGLLGLTFEREQHAEGPVHYAAELPTGTVVELYAAGGRPVTRARLGFQVRDRPSVADALRSAGFTVKRQSLVVDPDGNRVELHDADGDGNRVERP